MILKISQLFAFLAAGFLLFSTPSPAHHSFAATYVTDHTIKLEGEVVQFMFRNPHTILQILAPDEDGKMQRWAAEWAGTLVLERSGARKDVLKPGDRVIVVGYPSRNKVDHRLRVKTVERPSDGWKWGGEYD